MSIFYDKQRVGDLRKFCAETLIKVIAPEVVLATGKSSVHFESDCTQHCYCWGPVIYVLCCDAVQQCMTLSA